DRLHNMRTLEHLDDEKQRRIALETREIYAPLAHRFGMAGVKAELEDLAFKFLERDDYRGLSRKVRAKKVERERTIERLRAPLGDALREASLADIEITGRPKNLWSIYKKMKKRDKPFEEIYDLLAVRVLVNSIPECYHVLGIIHHKWTPLQERIKDYIASPKSNGYQSLHTTVFGPGGQLYEIQIRTRDMHHTAADGIPAPWAFRGAHGGGPARPGRAHQRAHRPAAPPPEERRHRRGPDEPAGEAVARLACPRGDRPSPPQDPTVDQAGGAREEPRARP